MKLRDDEAADQKLLKLRNMYEPYIYALGTYLSQPLPPWIPLKKGKDNWQTTAWAQISGQHTHDAGTADDHF